MIILNVVDDPPLPKKKGGGVGNKELFYYREYPCISYNSTLCYIIFLAEIFALFYLALCAKSFLDCYFLNNSFTSSVTLNKSTSVLR